MHIKQVLISGFKSFRSQGEIEEFSPHHNVIVGRNGSGKSNFFDAIQFVLAAPKFATLRQEDRQNLLHEGAGSSVMAAYVEIIFDNSDGRMSVESDEVVIRRTVGHKKDEFFLNRKRIQKAEIVSLLESAGFSKSNPYYIVQQGKVANLCVMKDTDRLQLLKEVAGTSVYEERRVESMKILQDTKSKQEKVEEVLTYIEERLSELEAEKTELSEYEQLDKQRRAIEHALYTKELNQAKEALENIDNHRDENTHSLHEHYRRLYQLQEDISSLDVQLQKHQVVHTKVQSRLSAKQGELQSFQVKHQQVTQEVQDFRDKLHFQLTEAEECRDLIQRINSSIEKSENQVSIYTQDSYTLEQNIHAVMHELHTHKNKLEILMLKKQQHKFSSQKERDTYINAEIKALQGNVAGKQKLLQSYQQNFQELEGTRRQYDVVVNKLEKDLQGNMTAYQKNTTSLHNFMNNRNTLQDKRKELWMEMEKCQEEKVRLVKELSHSKELLNKTLPYHIVQGLQIIEEMVATKNMQGYYGPLIDNIMIKNEVFNTVIDKIAGTQLFHIVVDNEADANACIQHLEKNYNIGRLTFLPLNRLKVPRYDYSALKGNKEVKILMDVALDYEDFMKPAVDLVFGGRLLAPDLHTATDVANAFRMDTLTIDGDLVSGKGSLEGGFIHSKFNKIALVNAIREVTIANNNNQTRLASIEGQVQTLDNQINNLVKEVSRVENEQGSLQEQKNLAQKDLQVYRKNIQTTSTNIETMQHNISTLEQDISNLDAQIYMYRGELKKKYINKVSAEEESDMQSFEMKIQELNNELQTQQDNLQTINNARKKLTIELHENLYRQKEEVENKLILLQNVPDRAQSTSTGAGRFVDYQQEIDKLLIDQVHLEHMVEKLQGEVNKLQQESSDLSSNVISILNSKYNDAKQQEKESTAEIDNLLKDNDKLLNKRSIYLETIGGKTKVLKEIGLVSQELYQKYMTVTHVSSLQQELKQVSSKLSKYTNINRKALDQYISFNEQRVTLKKRQAEITKDYDSICLLIQNLDVQKDNNIIQTFQNVNKHFQQVFSELVPNGKGQLVLRNKDDIDLNEASAEEIGDISNISGIGVEVSFHNTSNVQNMQSLSGGQKALVALALIFAIQRCDPAPFYLFDEIDQALDANHRLTVAQLIQRQSTNDPSVYASININKTTKEEHYSPPQFITTTFRPELVNVADRWFGIALANKVSNIYPLTKDEAQDFVTNLMVEEEAVGTVSAIPVYSAARAPQLQGEAEEGDDEGGGSALEYGEGSEGEGEEEDEDAMDEY